MNYRQALDSMMDSYPMPRNALMRRLAETILHNTRLRCAALKPWPWNLRSAARRCPAGYETGTLAVTQNSRTATLTGGVFPTDCAGWDLTCHGFEEERYTISARVSDTEVTLDRQYEGESDATAQYITWLPYVIAPADLYKWKSIRFERGEVSLSFEDQAWFDAYFPQPETLCEGVDLVTHSKPTTVAQESASTVTIAAGSANVTRAAGAWPENVIGHHIRFQGEEPLYEVQSRTSDTVLVLDRDYGGSFPGSGIAYELDPPGCLRVEINPPQEDQFALKFRYYAEPRLLVNDSDELEGTMSYQKAVIAMSTGAFITSNLPDPSDPMAQHTYQRMMQVAQTFQEQGNNLMKSLIGNEEAPEQFARIRNIRDM